MDIYVSVFCSIEAPQLGVCTVVGVELDIGSRFLFCSGHVERFSGGCAADFIPSCVYVCYGKALGGCFVALIDLNVCVVFRVVSGGVEQHVRF